jgi:hypothetical protein
MPRKLTAVLLSFVILLAPALSVAGQNEKREVTTPCNAHLASVTDNSPHAYEKYFEWRKAPKIAATDAGAKLPNTVAVIAVAPITAKDYTTIFSRGKADDGKGVTEAQQKEIEAVQATLKTKFGKDQGDRDFSEKNYEKLLQAQSASFLIVVGHNEHGFMHLLDGSKVFLDDIARAAGPKQRVIMISCDSASHVSSEAAATIKGRLTYDRAFAIAEHISNFITAAKGPVSLTDIKAELAENPTGVGAGLAISLFIMKAFCAGGALIVVALIIRQLDPCKDGSHTPGCPPDEGTPKQKDTEKAPKQNDKPSGFTELTPSGLLPVGV